MSSIVWMVSVVHSGNIYVKIIDRDNYKELVELNLDSELYNLFRKIIRWDKYSLQYIEHPIFSEVAKIKLKQSSHIAIKKITESDIFTHKPNEFYV